jgi:hypothetical protein
MESSISVSIFSSNVKAMQKIATIELDMNVSDRLERKGNTGC